MAWNGRARWTVLLAVLGATFGCWCLRAIAMGDPPISRLTLAPRHREPGEGREAPGPAARDLEIRVSAPADARSVVVTMPDGETRSARYDPDRGVCTLRFFIDNDTSARVYDVGVSIIGEDGYAESLRLPYAVSTHAPAVSVSLRRAARHRDDIEITAR